MSARTVSRLPLLISLVSSSMFSSWALASSVGAGFLKQPEHPERPGIKRTDGDVAELLEDPVVGAHQASNAVDQVPYRAPGEAEDEHLPRR